MFLAAQRESGRIKDSDIEACLQEDGERPFPFSDWTRRDFKKFRLDHLFEIPGEARIRYLLEEGDLILKRSHLSLWRSIRSEARVRVEAVPKQAVPVQEVHSFLIRFCGAYLDQGISYWPMPVKNGLYQAFLCLYSQPAGPALPWQRRLSAALKQQVEARWTSSDALEDALRRLGIRRSEVFAALRERALALRGWAGMISVLEKRPDLAPIEAPPVRLLDFLAIYLQLEVLFQDHGPMGSTRKATASGYELTYEAFVLAQRSGFELESFGSPEAARAWVREVREFHDLARRRTLLEAYERRYRQEVVDSLIHHCRAGASVGSTGPRFQAVFCIDDREESLRRHLEELNGDLETFGYVGFFGVGMLYQGISDPHASPLCPPAYTPRHLVREVSVSEERRATALGTARQTWRASRNSLVRGGLLSLFTGFLAGIPLVGQTFFPGFCGRIGTMLEGGAAKPLTRLALERPEGQEPNDEGLYEGFTIGEMTEIVKAGVETIGVTRFASLFAVVGHGSSSLNNPHEAAHDCGATGGGRGGPNARAFCLMANHPEVRRQLQALGIKISEETWFVAAYHNTCDDSMTYYDLDLVPDSHRQDLVEFKELLHRGCVLDAHERCRRFENVPLSLSPQAAYRHVQARAVTLAQPRPEYGHCTNSLCVVGRRERTRGLFFDRRVFLCSYDPTNDQDGSLLGRLLESVGPVGAGINLEYYFSSIDPSGYGCGTKLPHNVTGLLGVMDGHASDLRTGLPWQMVEIHEPMRLLNIVESSPELLLRVLEERPALKDLLDKEWMFVVAWSPEDDQFWLYKRGCFVPHELDPESHLPRASTSLEYYQGHREHLPPARLGDYSDTLLGPGFGGGC